MLKIRTPLAAAGLAVLAAIGLTGMSLRGESRESSIVEKCAHETWPAIPAYCLIDAQPKPFRMVSVDRGETKRMAERFAAAFE
jgi:hypothetical protein